MRNIPSYQWEDVLNELVPRTFIGLELLKKEKEKEAREYEKMNRRNTRKK